MTSKSKSHSLLVKGASKPQEGFYIPANDLSFEQNMLRFPDKAASPEIISDHTAYRFDAENPQRVVMERQFEEAQARTDELKADLDKQKQVEKDTPERICSAIDDNGETALKIPFKEWEGFDRFSFGLLIGGFLLISFVAGVNVFVTIMASQEPVFINAPWLAALISILPVCGGIAVKFTSHLFTAHSAKKRYAYGVFLLTTISLFIWLMLFSLQFDAFGSDFDIHDLLDESGGKGSKWLVFFQIFSEVLTGASLFLGAQNIALRYTREVDRVNPQYAREAARTKALTEEYEAALKARDDIHKNLVALNALRQLAIKEALAAFNAASSRIHSNTHY